MESTELRLKKIEKQAKGGLGWPLRIVLLGVLGGIGGILYVTTKQDQANVAENGVILPQVLLKKASAARHDLAMLDRELYELAVEADKHLTPKPGEGNKKRAERYTTQLTKLKATGKEIEPKLTREETIVYMATEHAEGLIARFIALSFDNATFDHTLIEKAEKQLGKASSLAQGEASNPLLKSGTMKSIALAGKEVANVKENLKIIKESHDMAKLAAEQNADALNIPELDGVVAKPSSKHHHKKKEAPPEDAPAEE